MRTIETHQHRCEVCKGRGVLIVSYYRGDWGERFECGTCDGTGRVECSRQWCVTALPKEQ